MARRINKKCQHCATLSVEEAIALHGPEGDNCWNPDNIRQLGYNCHRRRNHYRHRDDDNRTRRRMRRQVKQEQRVAAIAAENTESLPTLEPVEFAAPPPPAVYAAVLVLYRHHKDAPVHAVAAEIWQGDRKVGEMKAVHCMGMRGDQVTAYLQQVLLSLREKYGVGRFEDVVKELPVERCPIAECPQAQVTGKR